MPFQHFSSRLDVCNYYGTFFHHEQLTVERDSSLRWLFEAEEASWLQETKAVAANDD